jgi:hypothetical protein
LGCPGGGGGGGSLQLRERCTFFAYHQPPIFSYSAL